MSRVVADYFPKRMKNFVSGMTFSANVAPSGDYLINFGTPVAFNSAYFTGTEMSCSLVTRTYTASEFETVTVPDRYGRNLVVHLGQVTNLTLSRTLNVHGWDYLGQYMVERFQCAGTGMVLGVKAFKWLEKAVLNSGDTISGVLVIGIASGMGVPYRVAGRGDMGFIGGAVATGGTLVVGQQASVAQTASTADPRGLYNPTGAVSTSGDFILEVKVDRDYMMGTSHSITPLNSSVA